MFEEVAKKLGCETRAYSPPYRLQANGKIKCFHTFLKACRTKHINRHLEWDEVIPMVTATYNCFPHTPSRERPFFLMFGKDPLTGLQKLLGETARYLGEGGGKLDLTTLKLHTNWQLKMYKWQEEAAKRMNLWSLWSSSQEIWLQ